MSKNKLQEVAEKPTKQKSSSKGEELIKRHEVSATPFMIIEHEKKFFGSLANYRITEEYDSLKECQNELTAVTWNRIVQVTMLLIETIKSEK